MNKKEKIEITITAGLVVILIVIVAGKFQKKPMPPAPQVAVPQFLAEVQRISDSSNQKLAEIENEYDEVWRDPFGKPETRSYKGLKLNGIIWDEKKPLAVVNDQMVHIGMVINGYEVVSIRPRSAVFNNGKEEIEISLQD